MGDSAHMKRNFYFCFMVLFILSACQPSPGGQGQAATATRIAISTSAPMPTKTVEIKATPTSEVSFKINSEFEFLSYQELSNNYDNIVAKYSNVTWEDIVSGKLFMFEQKYIQDNPIFDSNKIVNIPLFLNGSHIGNGYGEIDHLYVDFLSTYLAKSSPESRTIKIVSYFQFKDKEFFTNLGINPEENNKNYYFSDKWAPWLITWAHKNSDGKIKLIHSIVDIFSFSDSAINLYPKGRDIRPGFVYDYTKVKMSDENIRKDNNFIAYSVYQNYPQYKPDKRLIEEWVKTGNVSEDLQISIFQLYCLHYWK